ncbi:MAG: sigma-70 domain-containing protein [Lachnospiraceae bacterium]|nr:sigma-70 domain-containing protein [Lachnospiraceae bacterium]
MERELLFADKLQEIRNTAKAQGNLVTEAQVEEAFLEFSLDKEKLNMVYDYLRKHNIGVGEPVDETEYLTDGEKNFLQLYLDEVAALDTVSEGEKEAITLSAMAGETAAQEKLIHIYLPEVADVAKLYAGQGVCIEDLIGEGNVAVAMGVRMLGALERADEVPGMLGKMMMDAMEAYISENAEEGKKDRHIAEKVNKVADAARELSKAYGRKVSAEELAAEGELSLKTIKDAIRVSGGKIEDLEKEG